MPWTAAPRSSDRSRRSTAPRWLRRRSSTAAAAARPRPSSAPSLRSTRRSPCCRLRSPCSMRAHTGSRRPARPGGCPRSRSQRVCLAADPRRPPRRRARGWRCGEARGQRRSAPVGDRCSHRALQSGAAALDASACRRMRRHAPRAVRSDLFRTGAARGAHAPRA